MALPKANRLTSRQDFRVVFREGIRCRSSHLTLLALRLKVQTTEADMLGKPISKTQIGISISTKVSKRAVIRNRIKRQIRAVFRYLLPKISAAWLLVVVVEPSAAQQECDYQQFLQELKQLLAEAEVLDGHS